MRTTSRLLTIASLVVLFLSGCTPPLKMPTQDQLVGDWVHVEGSNVATLTLQHDFTLRVSNTPQNLFLGRLDAVAPDWQHTLDATGTWKVGGYHGTEPYLGFYLNPNLDNPGAGGWLNVSGQPNKLELYLYIGLSDEGNKFIFTKVP